MKILKKHWSIIIFLLSFIAISSALIAEYIFNIIPCNLCYNQRYPYYFIILIFVIFYLIGQKNNIWFFVLVKISLLYGLFYSIWHVGTEKKIFSGPASCSGINTNSSTLEELKENIANQSVISCGDITWYLFGISAATINSILLIIILIFNTIYIYRIRND